MRRAARVAWLVVSRVFIALLVGWLYIVSRIEMQGRAHVHKPLNRALQYLPPADPILRETFGEDLEQLSRSGHSATAEVIGLLALLRADQLPEARERCKALGWTRCEVSDLHEMRKHVFP